MKRSLMTKRIFINLIPCLSIFFMGCMAAEEEEDYSTSKTAQKNNKGEIASTVESAKNLLNQLKNGIDEKTGIFSNINDNIVDPLKDAIDEANDDVSALIEKSQNLLSYPFFFVGTFKQAADVVAGIEGNDIIWDLFHQTATVSNYTGLAVTTSLGGQVGIYAGVGVGIGKEDTLTKYNGYFSAGSISSTLTGLPKFIFSLNLQAGCFVSATDSNNDKKISLPGELDDPLNGGLVGCSVGLTAEKSPLPFPYSAGLQTAFYENDQAATKKIWQADQTNLSLKNDSKGYYVEFGKSSMSNLEKSVLLASSILENFLDKDSAIAKSAAAAAIKIGQIRDTLGY